MVRVVDAVADVLDGGGAADGGVLREIRGVAGHRGCGAPVAGGDRCGVLADRRVLLFAHRQADVFRCAGG